MRVKNQKIIFYDQLATLLANDLSLIKAIEIIAEDGEKNYIQKSTVHLYDKLKNGTDVLTGLKEYPVIFPEIIVEVVRRGADGSRLAPLFSVLAEEQERIGKFKKRLILSLLYPSGVFLVALALMALMVTFVTPVFSDIYEGFGMSLPLPTLLLIDLAAFFQKFGLLFLLLIVAIGALIFYKSSILPRITFILPGFNKMATSISLCSFSRFLSVLCRLDLPARECIDLATTSLFNSPWKSKIRDVAKQSSKSASIGDVLKQSNIFPPLFCQMVRVGERGGALPDAFETLAAYYEREVQRTRRFLVIIVDILAIIFVAVLVGLFVFSMYLPLFHMASVVG